MELRRLGVCAGVVLALTVAACGSSNGGKAAGTGCEATPEQTEGPYYKSDPPERTSLVESSVVGRRLSIAGRVLDTNCKAVARARVDFWQADGNGAYDNAGYRLRGYQITDNKGRYRVETVVPGLYEGRTRHIHVKVTPPGGRTLTTQLYFPGEPRNQSDGIFTPKTLVNLNRGSSPWRASFQFIVSD